MVHVNWMYCNSQSKIVLQAAVVTARLIKGNQKHSISVFAAPNVCVYNHGDEFRVVNLL